MRAVRAGCRTSRPGGQRERAAASRVVLLRHHLPGV